MDTTRRRFLATAGLATVGALAGCTGGSREAALTLDTLAVGSLDGGPLRVQPTDRPVLLDFFATWCAPCKPQMSDLAEIRSRYGPDRLHMLSITWERDAEVVRAFWEEYGGTWPTALDPDVQTGEHYGVSNLPTLLVFTADGEEVWRHVGLASLQAIDDAVRRAGVA
ncbi:TlpA family protein disulfide reductase [Haladaptatus sp. GCM10025707]|uniref:TlpA family protein disulfide reductase n=1 Tax=unclassified Haladaptatus TaxID=2622732 RepID=UPI0023E7D718|nr:MULTISPECIES: redoxin family protein [unclassified Haladaptatus]